MKQMQHLNVLHVLQAHIGQKLPKIRLSVCNVHRVHGVTPSQQPIELNAMHVLLVHTATLPVPQMSMCVSPVLQEVSPTPGLQHVMYVSLVHTATVMLLCAHHVHKEHIVQKQEQALLLLV